MNSNKAVAPVPAKTIERLVIYRTLLEGMQAQHKTQVFSNEIAGIVGNTAAQVRRDLMAVGYSGNTRNGYRTEDLLNAIQALLQTPGGVAMAIAGIGNLGRALLGYFAPLHPRFRIVAAFDNDENKINRLICGYRVHHIREMEAELARTPAQLGIITVPPDQAQRIADAFVKANVKGLVNFAAVPLRAAPGVRIENMHITATLEKVAYFCLANTQGEQAWV